MQKKGIVKIAFHSFQSSRLKGNKCSVRITAADVQLTASVPYKEQGLPSHYFLPVADKIVIEMLSSNEEVGYFELPMKKIYDIPLKKHIITINCITRDLIQKSIKPEQFGSLKVSVVFLENWVGKFDVFVDRLELIEQQLGTADRQLYVQCLVGNVASQTTLKKSKELTWYEFKQVLPFTLQSIPGKIELTVKDKDMVNDQIMSRFVLDPQKQGVFSEHQNKKDHRIENNVDKRRTIIYCQTSFKLKEAI